MQKGIFVKDMAAPNEAEGVFVITLAAQGSSRNGPYWRLVLADASGSVEAKIWSPLSASFPALHTGSFFYAHGRVSTFRDQLQFTVEEGRLLSPEEGAALDLADFMPASPYPLDAMMDELMGLIREEFRYKPWRKLVDGVFKNEELREAFRTCPAAKGVHHAYAGGLLEHTLSVFKLCRRLADQYPELDRQTLLAGALFHDFGKIREFSGGIANDYTDEGRLLGHLEICVEMLAPYLERSGLEPELQRHLKHLVLSHHGTLEFGAVRVPQTAEALVLHYADNIDAKMAQCRGPGSPSWAKARAGRPIRPPWAGPCTAARRRRWKKKSKRSPALPGSLPGRTGCSPCCEAAMFITFEGIEGSGKTTARQLLALELEKRGHDVLLTREPGGCGLGRALRPILLDARNSGLCNRPSSISSWPTGPSMWPRSSVRRWKPDRSSSATAIPTPPWPIRATAAAVIPTVCAGPTIWPPGGLQPDLTLLCDLPVSVGLERAGLRNRREGTVLSEGRFDSESLNFHERVRQGYLTIAAEEPDRIAIIDASQQPEDVVLQCLSAVERHLKQRGSGLE